MGHTRPNTTAVSGAPASRVSLVRRGAAYAEALAESLEQSHTCTSLLVKKFAFLVAHARCLRQVFCVHRVVLCAARLLEPLLQLPAVLM